MTKTVKIPWDMFIETAVNQFAMTHPGAKNPQFMRVNGYSGDSNICEIPDYVEMEIL